MFFPPPQSTQPAKLTVFSQGLASDTYAMVF